VRVPYRVANFHYAEKSKEFGVCSGANGEESREQVQFDLWEEDGGGAISGPKLGRTCSYCTENWLALVCLWFQGRGEGASSDLSVVAFCVQCALCQRIAFILYFVACYCCADGGEYHHTHEAGRSHILKASNMQS
jgi:hypothetical protein